ncbi:MULTISPECIES: hypothetical protein [Streptomyces]|uniref:hypothetical protein n=1 Tax=Streptomyces TaxID=1883 RepID=UPI000805BF23|nr:hypothetical protein [Streptomyces sp. MnatMP-M77]MYT82186.1 hypothetical protein [Streptomyces sp. SID8364]NEB51989.1 hypothetical protein [Streptomyces griseus]SBU98091.1 hypothetical protein YW3DRAFT_06196 [Streptomyces sp. MnatMP-M77]
MSVRKKTALALAAVTLTTGLATGAGAATAAPASASASASGQRAAVECGVRADGKLWCGNRVGAKGYEHRTYRSGVRGSLTSSFSWFVCWGPGDNHAGGNNIWYWTLLDNGQWGNVPAVDVHTPSDPWGNLRQC